MAATPERLAKYALLAVNFFIETNRMEAFVAVYFITFKDWKEFWFGIVSLVMNVVMIIFQTPAGDLLDKTHHKKTITAAAVLVASVTTVCVAWTSNFWAILVAKAVEGIAATIFLMSLMSLLLGICTTKDEVPTFIAACEVSNKIGSVLFTLGCGVIAYFLYPNITSLFYLLGGGGLLTVICLLMIPTSAIDYGRARQLQKDGKDEDSAGPVAYSTLLKDRRIVMFGVLTVMYHLANAGIAPLLAQQIAIQEPKRSMLFTSAILLLAYATQAISAQLMRTAVVTVNHKRLLIIAHLLLPVRCGTIAALLTFWPNAYAISATQLFDGIGAGIYDTMIPIVVATMTEGTGRFGVAYGFIVTCWRTGHGLSLLLGESMVHGTTYKATFLTLGGIGILSLGLLTFGVTIPQPSPAMAPTRTDHDKVTVIDEELEVTTMRNNVLDLRIEDLSGDPDDATCE